MTDSKSVLSAPQNIRNRPSISDISDSNKIKVTFVCIKPYIGLEDNGIADRSAKRSSREGETVDILLPYTDLYSRLPTMVLRKWKTEYSEGCKGIFYNKINSSSRK